MRRVARFLIECLPWAALAACIVWIGGVFGVVVGVTCYLAANIVIAVASGLYLGIKGVVDYHGGWRGTYRYMRGDS